MLWSEHSLNDWDVQHSHPKSSYKTLSKTGCSISNDFEFLFKKICVGVIPNYNWSCHEKIENKSYIKNIRVIRKYSRP